MSASGLAVTATTVLALGLRLYQFTRGGSLSGIVEYDDGPYFGSAVELVHGILPYRDFIFVQPPGITLLMTPVALLSRLTGTAAGMAVGRVLTTLAGTAGVALAGVLVRHRGPLAVLVAAGLVAVSPPSAAAAHTVLVEPWLVLFCLAGAVAVFDGDRLASGRRMFWGGLAFGFAGAVEAWAIVPVIVIAVLGVPRPGQVLRFAAGVASGFLVPVVPFAALSPHGFYQSLITAQIGHRANATRVSVLYRFKSMLGLGYIRPWSGWATVLTLLIVAGFVLCAVSLATIATHRPPPVLEWFALVTTVMVAVMFLWPAQFHYHFSAFLSPFLSMSIALPLSTCIEAARRLLGRVGAAALAQGTAAAVAVLMIGVFAVLQVATDSNLPAYPAPLPKVQALIPPGACVVSDQVSYPIMADRFVSDVPGCPHLLDSLGTDLALSGGLKPETGAWKVPAVMAMWYSAFAHAQYVWLSFRSARRIAWTPGLRSYFHDHFVLYFREHRERIYARKGLRTPVPVRPGGAPRHA